MISRRKGERIMLGSDTEIIVADIRRKSVRLAVRAAPGLQVLRGEVRDAIAEENRRAAAGTWTDGSEPPPPDSVVTEASIPPRPTRAQPTNEQTGVP